MKIKSIYFVLTALLLVNLACAALTSRITPSSTPPPKATVLPTNTSQSLPTKANLPTQAPRAATLTPTLAGRPTQGPPTPSEVLPTISTDAVKSCQDGLPANMPESARLMAFPGADGAAPMLVCDLFKDNINVWTQGDMNGDYVTGVETIENNALRFDGVSKDGAVWYDFVKANYAPQSFTLVVSARILAGPDKTLAGIFYRYDGDNYYLLEVSRTMYDVYIFYHGSWEEILAPQPVPAGFNISDGPAWIGLDVSGDSHTIFLNGERVNSFQDNRLMQGEVGLGMDIDANPDVHSQVEFYTFILRGE